MKWATCNAIGAAFWLSGLMVAKGEPLPIGNSLAADEHHLLTGMIFGAAGLAVLLWTNLRSPA